ncbi:sugar transferase [Aurantiacibacter poecillastricola]|uniref:sugar transferase n=1 Tax=Aurantiacibacter poecillastricola TaxID=3064385 RepID=UPI00273DB9A6|nr:sugar transferase [Aurantiacibacter sp. 219JJ12-13]MDP5263210.1 sugar transferase [Aurantiacibacter sp. 219JJ12-13]
MSAQHQEREHPPTFELPPMRHEVRPMLHRMFDIAIAVFCLLLFWPAFLVIGLALKLTDSGPIFFGHRRIGRNGRTFRCLKFRSMVLNAEQRLEEVLSADPAAAREWRETQKLRKDPRITPIGRFLRATSLDELPQLFNVLAGQMSIVGPRPIVADEAERYEHVYQLYCRANPGMTGLSQISGRSHLSYAERVLLDAQYFGRKSIREDLRILIFTVPVVLRRDGSC